MPDAEILEMLSRNTARIFCRKLRVKIGELKKLRTNMRPFQKEIEEI
jgi:hypothetical protein